MGPLRTLHWCEVLYFHSTYKSLIFSSHIARTRCTRRTADLGDTTPTTPTRPAIRLLLLEYLWRVPRRRPLLQPLIHPLRHKRRLGTDRRPHHGESQSQRYTRTARVTEMERGRFNPNPRAQGSGYGRGQRFGTHSGVSGILLPLLSCVLYIEVGFQGRLELFDEAASSVVLMEFDGVHFPKNGSFYAFAQEEGYVTRCGFPRRFV